MPCVFCAAVEVTCYKGWLGVRVVIEAFVYLHRMLWTIVIVPDVRYR